MSQLDKSLIKQSTFVFAGLYLFVLLPVNLVGHLLDIDILVVLSKPLLMPWLLLTFVFGVNPGSYWIKFGVVSALFFSWIGDIALMYDAHFPSLFIVGLGGFLFAHISYVLVFIKSANRLNRRGRAAIVLLPLFIIYGIALMCFLWNSLAELQIPVLVYASVLMAMGITAVMRQVKFGYTVLWIGATFFILSDSILAVNKFLEPVWFAGVWTMLTYGLAQLLIVLSLIASINSPIQKIEN